MIYNQLGTITTGATPHIDCELLFCLQYGFSPLDATESYALDIAEKPQDIKQPQTLFTHSEANRLSV